MEEINDESKNLFTSATGVGESCARSIIESSDQTDVKQAKRRSEQSCESSSEKRKSESEVTETIGVQETTNVSSTAQQQKQKHGKIARGFSMVDPEMVSKLHSDIKMKGKDGNEESYGYFQDVVHFSFTLPDFSQYDKEFVEFLMKDLIENLTLKALEGSGHLNWLANNDRFQRLLPLATSGDGNCLLHAASLGIWGVHDRLLNLREAVHRTLSSSLAERTIKRRWRWYQWVKNMREGELVFSEIEWEKEWKLLLSLAAPRPRSSLTRQSLATVAEVGDRVKDTVETSVNQVLKPRRFSSSSEPRYESLEELHVFSLAHVLRRPIIVVADTVLYDFEGNAICPIPFGGVYLPIECDPAECCRIPLVLAYSSAHFSPIVAMELPKSQSKTELNGIGNKVPAAKAVIPLVDKALKPLLLPFAVDPGEDWDWSKQDNSRDVMKEKSLTSDQRMLLLKKYLDVEYIDLTLAPLQNNEQRREEESSKASGSDLDSKEVEGVDIPVQHSVAVVELPCRHQPSYYKELIERYIKKAKERFEFEQEMKGPQTESEMASIRCANDGCDMYGTVANNYLCTKCFQLQSNSIKEFKPKDIPENSSPAVDVPPPYHPPPYAEAVHDKCMFYPPSFLSTGSSKPNIRSQTLPKEEPTQCKAKECTFYGTADKNGFCSKCFQESQK